MIAAYVRFAERLPDSASGGEPFEAEKANYYSTPKGVSLARLRRTRVKRL
jgi:hypothetical protein